ncbi:MAG: transcription elongation factor GreA [Endomicrobiales bacterium]|nr:transcription elongation factor GreA [Endomicrobiales bacterium]
MAEGIYLTKEGRNKLVDELEKLKKRKPQLSEEIAKARELGDLKENAEYHAAKEALTNLQRRIAEIENKLSRAKILETKNTDKVYIGVTVSMREADTGDEYDYTIVDAEEANPAEKKISLKSPLAQGLLGHKKGDKVKVRLPGGETEYEILKIT